MGVHQTRQQSGIAEVDRAIPIVAREVFPAADPHHAVAGNQHRPVLDRRPGDGQDDAGAEEELKVAG